MDAQTLLGLYELLGSFASVITLGGFLTAVLLNL